MLANHEVAAVFRAIADTMEVLGDDRYRLLAYRRAGETLANLPRPLADYRADGTLDQIPGVGKAIAEKIVELLDTGRLEFYERLRARLPAGVLDMLRVPEVGPRTAMRLYQELGITSLDDLRAAAESGRVRALKGLGTKVEARILAGLEALARGEHSRIHLGAALLMADALVEALLRVPGVERASIAGSLRRARPTIGDLDIVIATRDGATVMPAIAALPLVARVEALGPERATLVLHTGQQADILAVAPARWGSGLHHFTGNNDHRVQLRQFARTRGLSLSEDGFRCADGCLIECRDEEQVYAELGLPWIPPELREGLGEIEAAQAGALPALVALPDVRCDLHMHTTWSDGTHDIRSMAEAARARGYTHIAIADHSAYIGVTRGLDGTRLRSQAEEIRAVNAAYAADGVAFRVLCGVEVDILPDGGLALPDEVLAELDVVVASPHVSLRQPREQATARLLRAIANPHVDIIGHPTGRILNGREGSDLDMEAVLQAAAEHHVLLEINGGPDRLDLDATYVRRALELGCTLVTNSDAHAPRDLDWMRLAIATARRGWAPAGRIANTWTPEALLEWVAA